MSRDDESPKYELNMTDYDEGRLEALRVGLSADLWIPENIIDTSA